MRRGDPGAERGAALVTVLALLSILSIVALLVTESAQLALRRTQNQSEIGQARWYLFSAEAFAVARIEDIVRRVNQGQIDPAEWQDRPFTFPLDEGVMVVTIRDGTNCFNLNGLVLNDDSGRLSLNATSQVQFARLLDLLDVRAGSGEGLVGALVDWLDTDSAPSAGGAEDEAYPPDESHALPANALMADVSELAAVRGFTPDIQARLAGLACVRPKPAPNLLNFNTLTPAQAPLVSAILGRDVPVSVAAEIIRSRPAGGWRSVTDVFNHPRLSGLDITDATKALFDLKPRYFVIGVDVRYRGQREAGAALIEIGAGARVVRRVFGAAGVERVL